MMKTKFNGILTLLFALVMQISFAQEKTVTGTVSDNSGPLPGVSVVVKGTNKGSETDFDGNYSLKAKTGDVLVFRYLGYKTTEKTVGSSSVINIAMSEDENVLGEVVVTAQGIKKEKKALGYSVKTVSGEDLEQKAEGDISRALSGKSAGVQITSQSGMSGSATNIVVRGMSSFSSSNQALFIVDGVPFSTATNPTGDFIDGNNGSSRFLDLDPNSIESISVLKGLAASTLYGSEGRNGVILVTTKAGAAGNAKKKSEITVSTSTFVNEIASLPDYQNEYGGGFDQAFGWFFSNWGPSFNQNGVSGWGNSNAINGTNSGTPGFLVHPYATSAAGQAAFPEFQNAIYEYKPYNSVENFFRVGTIVNTSINARGASTDGNISYNLNYGHLSDEGFTPGNKLTRNTLAVGGRAKLSNKFTVTGTMNFALTGFVSPPVALSQGNGATGGGSSVFGDLWFTPRSINVQGLPFQDPVTGGSVYYRQDNAIQHPLWTVANAQTKQETNRVFGSVSMAYEITEKLNLTYRAGLDYFNENNVNSQNKGGVNTNSGDVRLASGIYETWNNKNSIWDHSIILSGGYALNDDLNLGFNIGGTSRNEIFEQRGASSDGQQVFGVLRHFNFLNTNPIEFTTERNIVGAYTQIDLDFRNYLFLTMAGRNDWVSNFSAENRSIFYPSASVSFLPTSAFENFKSEKMNYLKIRAGYGTSAGFGSTAYPVAGTLVLNTFDNQDNSGRNIVTNTSGTRLGNPDLKPERVKEFEVGIESRLLNNRVTLDLSLYNRTTEDLIIDRPLDPSTGFTVTSTNVGEIEGKGIELDLGVDILKNDKFNWNTNINFTSSRATVNDLGLDTDQVIYAGFSNLGNVAIAGESLYSIFGSKIARDDEGNFLVGSDGNYLTDPVDGIIGDSNPDWILNLSNSISYKNFSFDFLFNYTKGGDMYSSTISTLLGRGLITETIDRENTFVLPGVKADGSPNDIQINNSTYYFNNVLFGPSELQVYDATTLRLQEISLGYNLSKEALDNTPFGSVSVKFSGFNLWYRAINTPKGANFDPNTAGLGVGNGSGFDFINGPSTRRYGISLKATF